jgi:hypothetical protein
MLKYGWIIGLMLTTAHAQDKAEPLVTDRPDFTESAVAVPVGVLQIELGSTYEQGSGVKIFSGPELLLRYGFTKRWEWRLGLPDYAHQSGGGSRISGTGDTYIGFKYQAGPTRAGWDISIIPAMNIPTGDSGFGSGHWDPEVLFCLSQDLHDNKSWAMMAALSAPMDTGSRNFTWHQTLVFGYTLNERLSLFLEYAGTFPRRGNAQHLLHSGFAYALDSRSQLDFHFGFGLSNASPDYFIGFGYAIKLF